MVNKKIFKWYTWKKRRVLQGLQMNPKRGDANPCLSWSNTYMYLDWKCGRNPSTAIWLILLAERRRHKQTDKPRLDGITLSQVMYIDRSSIQQAESESNPARAISQHNYAMLKANLPRGGGYGNGGLAVGLTGYIQRTDERRNTDGAVRQAMFSDNADRTLIDVYHASAKLTCELSKDRTERPASHSAAI